MLTAAEEKELHHLLEQEAQDRDTITWITGKNLINEQGLPLEFERHKFLLQPYRDESPKLCCMKASQIGFSTMAILKEIRLASRHGYNCIHTLPTDDDVRKFVGSKVDKIIGLNPALKLLVGATDNAHLKAISRGFVFYEGTKGQSKGIMTTSDCNIHDELDRSDQGTVETYGSRIKHSAYRGEWIFSNPSRPKVGIDIYWQRSDKKQWHVRCPHCGERQPLNYFINVDKERKCFICRKCKGIIADEDRIAGEWVAEFPDREWSGYHISQLIAPWITAAELITDEETKTQDYFYNFDLALPVIGGANAVSRHIILQCCFKPPEAPPKFTILGVDVGSVLHCVQGNEHGITRVFTLTDWDALESYFTAQGISLCIVDNAPETDKAEKFVKRHPGRAYRAIFDYNDKRQDVQEFIDKGDHRGIVNIHRTRAIDQVIETYSRCDVKVFILAQDPQLVGNQRPDVTENCLCDHWETLYTCGEDGQDVNIVKHDRMGNVIRTWENSGPDHYAMANVYFEIARQRKLPAAKRDDNLPRSIPRSRLSRYTGY